MYPARTVAALLLTFAVFSTAAPARAAEAPVTIAISAESFEFQGDWTPGSDEKQKVLMAPAKPPRTGVLPAATAVSLPHAGRYRLWVCTRDWPEDRPGTRTFAVGVGNQKTEKTFGTSRVAAYGWEDGGDFDLPAGPLLLSLRDPRPFARLQGLLLTTDLKLKPRQPVGTAGLPATPPLAIGETGPATPDDLKIEPAQPMATLTTGRARFDFLPATRSGRQTVAIRVSVKVGDAWIDAGADSAAEGYFITQAAADARLNRAGFYAMWPRGENVRPVTVDVGGTKLQTISGRTTRALWQAGERRRLWPRRAVQHGAAVRVEFEADPAGELIADWTPGSDGPSAAVSLTFTPANAPSPAPQIALSYDLPLQRKTEQVSEVLLPMMWQRHRLPSHPTTLLDNCMPTPIALVEAKAQATTASVAPSSSASKVASRTFAIVGEPADLPFAWPDGRSVHFGMSLTDEAGRVHPTIAGPVIGTPAAAAKPGQPVRLRFRVLALAGDWYAGYRAAADGIFALRDYRSNVRVSMTDAALNMIDLLKDDEHGGWWERAKAFYQIESKNGSSHAAPMLPLSIYRLTGDEEIYRKRALPTMQFMLSRDGPHFSPTPEDTGNYPAGSMSGPTRLFGTTVYGGLWELTRRRTDAFAAIALPAPATRPAAKTSATSTPDAAVKSTSGYSHGQPFDEWLSRYLMTGEKADLDRACQLADQYIATQITTPPGRDLGPQPFFLISFVPNWEGLLRLYEVTGRKEYLDAAAFGARQLMTGIWTQPLMPAGDTVIHPGGEYRGDAAHEWWKGPKQFRLGWPPAAGAIQQKSVPAWSVSVVGLGFEQPVTFDPGGPGRLIYEAAWAPHFLRLARYTGDPAFMTYARNAAVGRWGNYPGYYATGHTDLPQDPRYPLNGPDVTDFYYHHIPAHLAWTIDYLVSEAEALSHGKIAFSSLREHGYAYFDSRLFGHAAGKVYDDASAWLMFRRGLLTLDNVQVNYLTARGDRGLHIILTNQSRAEQTVTVSLSPDALHFDAARPLDAMVRIGDAAPEAMKLQQGRASVRLPPRGLAVVTVPAIKLDLPAQRGVTPASRPAARALAGSNPVLSLKDDVATTHAAAIQAEPARWDAYIWSTASATQARRAVLHYDAGGGPQSLRCDQYPFEFSVAMQGDQTQLRFHVELTRTDGTTVRGPTGVLGLRC